MTGTFRFAHPCREVPSRLTNDELDIAMANMRERVATDCAIELFFGFFFDGTGNNKYVSDAAGNNSQTNVARLYDVFNDDEDPSYSETPHRFRTYVEGVGTPCIEKVGDRGVGVQAQAGAAAGWGGEGRINWALLEFQNLLYRHYYVNTTLTQALGLKSPDIVREMSADMSWSSLQVRALAHGARLTVAAYEAISPGDERDVAIREDLGWAGSVWRSAQINDTAPNDPARRRVLARRNAQLREHLAGFLRNNPKIDRIRVSLFGFSRGAAEARVFANWLKDACDPMPGIPGEKAPLRLAGIPVDIDFMGLFDTVASVGIPSSVNRDWWDGHGAWARPEDLRIAPNVARCVHMVSAHEVRGSFPLERAEGPNCEEIVYPGVHSDVGGGYRPGEQGRGLVDADKLSQIPLCDMYREAMQAGVPMKLETAPDPDKARFFVSTTSISAFNIYLQATHDISRDQASLTHLIQQHYTQYLRWRHLRLAQGPEWLGNTASAQEARKVSPQEYEDLIASNEELIMEVHDLTEKNAMARLEDGTVMALMGPDVYTGLMAAMRGDKEEIWLDQIRPRWEQAGRPADAVVALLDNYVHDSRAAFKPLGESDDVWRLVQRHRLQRLEQTQQLADALAAAGWGMPLPPAPEIAAQLERYRANPEDVSLQHDGREPYWKWGYLRWRVIHPHLQDAQTIGKDSLQEAVHVEQSASAAPKTLPNADQTASIASITLTQRLP